ncbi:unnamed protein product [marine sediment metagenome]|uniref:Radical SAM core domain-containing protein n=1 Tax=marine sediment metagenome TaxID=412755 RepID=X1KZR1_9ZZZZ
MGLNKQTGNMYAFVTHTWNPIRGKCPHDCSYCYMKVYPQPELHFAEKEMKTNLGQDNFIFVGSSTDAWCDSVPPDWLLNVLRHCRKYSLNRYLFQSKNPTRFNIFIDFMPPDFILGTTIETNRDYEITQAPTAEARMLAMLDLPMPRMVSIEPIMDFDSDILVNWIRQIAPEFVSIGADSKGHHLPEPPAAKIQLLIEELKQITTIKIKNNLRRLTDVHNS